MKLIDIHAHLQFEQFDGDRAEVIARAREGGVGVINVGTDLETSRAAIKLAETNLDMWATVGIHPTDLPRQSEAAAGLHELRELVAHGKVVAIGECGLDYFHIKDEDERKEQTKFFEQQIAIAQEVAKPLMIHCRPSLGTQDAYQNLLEILSYHLKPTNYNLSGNVHFFAGTWAEAKTFLDLGFSLSFTGVITFARDYDEVIKNTPQDRIMVETDCPFVAPALYRGKRNEPVYVLEVLKKMAEIRGEDEENLRQAVLANACRFFGILL